MQVTTSEPRKIPTGTQSARRSLEIRMRNVRQDTDRSAGDTQQNPNTGSFQRLLAQFENGDGAYGTPPVSPVGTKFHSHEYTDAVIMVKLSSEQLDEKLKPYITDQNTSGIAHQIKTLYHHYQNPQFTGNKDKLITQIQNHFNTLTSTTGK